MTMGVGTVTPALSVIIGGIAPYFADSWTLILIERAIFGIGLGIISPLPNVLAMGLDEGDKVAQMMGLITLLMNIGGMAAGATFGAIFKVIKKIFFQLDYALRRLV
ncbi:hypothetical protein Q5O14_15235 [Eubacteriaceae bacterium ES2]|nr:hypothetical protein Q5O14_15235 [Eubacteriaceae bacterium ES2]